MISLQSMKRPPSPLQPERESSWRDFREAASERRKRARRRRLDVAFLAVGCAAAELPAGAAPALLPALAACGATFDGLCLVGVAHHVGVAVAAPLLASQVVALVGKERDVGREEWDYVGRRRV